MKFFFRKHLEGFLVGFTIVLVGIMAFCFVWGITYVSQNLDSVFEARSAETQTISFNLSGAKSLDLRGLVQHSE